MTWPSPAKASIERIGYLQWADVVHTAGLANSHNRPSAAAEAGAGPGRTGNHRCRCAARGGSSARVAGASPGRPGAASGARRLLAVATLPAVAHWPGKCMDRRERVTLDRRDG